MKRIISFLIYILIFCIFCVSCDSGHNKNATVLADTDTPTSLKDLPTDLDQQNPNKIYYVPISITEQSNGETLLTKITVGANNFPANVTYGDERIPTRNYTYDANGNVIKLVCTYASGDKTVTDYAYDENGNMVKYIYTTTFGGKEITDCSYDSNGNLIKSIFTLSSKASTIFEYTYDENGYITKEVHKYSKGDQAVTDYVYGDNEKLIKKTFTDFNGSKTVTDYTYGANQHLIKETCTNADDSQSVIEYVYNESENMVQKLVTYPNGATVRYNYVNGRLADSIFSDVMGYKITYEYTYDANGNLIKRVYTSSCDKKAGSNNTTAVIDNYTYDVNGNVIKAVTVGADGEIQKTVEIQYRPICVENTIPKQIQELLDDMIGSVYGETEK